MTVIPAIDLLGGACVRLEQGSYTSVRRYAEDPVEAALAFARAGARWVHVVDLDAARGAGADARYTGGDNRDAIRRIRAALQRAEGPGGAGASGDPGIAGVPGFRPPVCRLQVGGGIRAETDLAALSAAGADRLVLGTVLVRAPERVAAWVSARAAAARSGGPDGPELWAGIDAHDGRVRVAGWEEEGGLEDLELARRARELGLGGVVYTSIARDGMLQGPDIRRTNRVAEACGLPVVLSGGIGSAADVERVARESAAGVTGLIVGKALYEGRVELAELIRRYA